MQSESPPAKKARSSGPLIDFSGKRVLITGGSQGIGLDAAQLINRLGGEVVICARGEDALKAAKDSMSAPGRCRILVADVSTKEGVDKLAQDYPLTSLDVLVNNAGTNIRKRAEEQTDEEMDKVMSMNFLSVFRCSKVFLPLLKAAGRGATVVNISSVAGATHTPTGCAYGASKAAVDQLTRNLAVEWARFGIRVNGIAPGPVLTPLLERVIKTNPVSIDGFKERLPLQRIGQPEEVSNAIAFFASDAASWITGQTLMVDGGFTATSYNKIPDFWKDDL